MFAKRSCDIFFALLLLCQTTLAHNYRELFGKHYQKAETSAKGLQPLLEKYAQTYKLNSYTLEAIIFPELIRYNRLFDVVETGSLMGLYTRYGADYANFSIGLLQMKPTFAQSIEQYAHQHPQQTWVKALGFNEIGLTDTYENRSARVQRLNNTEWQIKYLVAMLKALQNEHARYWLSLTTEKQTVFAATAYNCGWNKAVTEINTYCSKPYYHLQAWNADVKYCFSEISVFRFRELNRMAYDHQ